MSAETDTVESPEAVLDRIMRDLGGGQKELPVEAIRAAQNHRRQIIPRLIRAVQEATHSAAEGNAREGNAHFFALFLLAEFRAAEALPAIVEAVSLPDELPFDLFGDAITETLARVFAALTGDDFDWLDDLIKDRSLSFYVRWEAAQTFIFLVRDGRLTRDEAVARLFRHLRDAVAGKDTEILEGLISELISYSPHEAADDIREVFRQDLVDPMMVSLEDVEESLKEGKSQFEKELSHQDATGIEDTVEELSTWAAFRDDLDQSEATEGIEADTPAFDIPMEMPRTWTAEESVRNDRPHVGRNDPCPCGSGKKFKRCCLGKLAADDA